VQLTKQIVITIISLTFCKVLQSREITPVLDFVLFIQAYALPCLVIATIPTSAGPVLE
jgi:hypothetical protein